MTSEGDAQLTAAMLVAELDQLGEGHDRLSENYSRLLEERDRLYAAIIAQHDTTAALLRAIVSEIDEVFKADCEHADASHQQSKYLDHQYYHGAANQADFIRHVIIRHARAAGVVLE